MVSNGTMILQQTDFLSSFVGSFQELRKAEELFDVTLACEDETIEAHKVVISSCSPFFRHVFSKTKQTHPFIYLKGVLMLLQNFSGLLISTFGLCNKSVVSADCKEYISFINWVYLNHKRRTCVIEHLEYLKLNIILCIEFNA